MFSCKLRLIMVVGMAMLLGACRSRPDDATQEAVTQKVITQEVTRIVTVESPIEITRIVEEVVEVTAVPTQTPSSIPQPKDLVICMVNEPTSLYLYDNTPFGIPTLVKQAVQHAIYENLYTTLSFEYQAQGIEKLPNIEEGDAEIRTIVVSTGDRVVDVNNELVILKNGVTVRDRAGNEVVFDDTPIEMPQMVVSFTLKPMVWSDGVPVTAVDSVFSFEIAADQNTPGNKSTIQRTADYAAIDDFTIQWTGVPGWLDPTYFTNIWPPLPAHQLRDYPIAELSEVPETTVTPLSNGPFVITEWAPGDHISMVKNPYYYRAGEGVPPLDNITYQFVENTNQLMALLLADKCDIATQDGLDMSQSALLLEAQASGLLSLYTQINTVFEHIDFGINPADSYADTRPDWFEDVRVRQAMVMCTDRQTMIDEALMGFSQIAHAYVPAIHPLYAADITEWPYDVTAANALLDAAGYRDISGNGIRQDPQTEDPFRVTLGINVGNQTRQQIAQMFQGNMADCGIDVELFPQLAADWFAAEGPLFGRRFDLAQFPWITEFVPACNLYITSEIPSEANGWLGNNETGWSNPAYDIACQSALDSLVGTDAYTINHQEALRIFSEQMPIIPLFSHLKLAVTQPDVTNFILDPTQDSELWNIFEIDLAP